MTTNCFSSVQATYDFVALPARQNTQWQYYTELIDSKWIAIDYRYLSRPQNLNLTKGEVVNIINNHND